MKSCRAARGTIGVYHANDERRPPLLVALRGEWRYINRMGWRDRVKGGAVGHALGGPAGAAIGVALAGGGDDRGYNLSDVPFGVHVEVDHEDCDRGRRWTLRFLSEVASGSLAVLRVLDDCARAIPGHAPFVDDHGHFAAFAPIDGSVASIFVPWSALDHPSPQKLSLEVSVWMDRRGGRAPAGKAIVDADLPPSWR